MTAVLTVEIDLSPGARALLTSLVDLLAARLAPPVPAPAAAPPVDATPDPVDATPDPLDPPGAAAKTYRNRGDTWSDQRIAVLEDGLRAGIGPSQMAARCNALPGPPITAGGVRKKLARMAQPSAPPGPRAPATSPVWTPERRALLAREYAAGVPRAGIVAQINALPGPPVTRQAMSVQAASMGLKRARVAPDALPAAPPAPEPVTPPPQAAVPRPPETAFAAAMRAAVAERQPPVVADTETVRRWAAERGIVDHALDLARVNARRVDLGVPPFAIPRHPIGVAGMST